MRSQPRYQPGGKIGGRYQIHQVKRGGMGEVYLCLDLETIQPYALKTFQQRYLTNPKLRAAFENEVATWVALEKHPNIVRCFYMDILDNQPFMVLEWIAGEEGKGTDLRSWLRRGPLELRQALDFTIDICRGLIHAQQKQPGLVHRDLKPENILVAQGRLAKITDFGLAQIVQAAELEIKEGSSEANERQSLVGQGEVVGTPPYMAPEQWRGEELDARTDIYAVGCILYELLIGSWAFEANTLASFRRQHLEADIPKLAESHDLPTVLNTLVSCCLAKRRKKRFASVDDLLRQLLLTYEQQFGEPPKAIPTSEEFTAEDYHNRGRTYRSLQLYEEALADYNRAIQLEPTLSEAYGSRGNAHYDLQQYDQALGDQNLAIQLAPDRALYYTSRGNTYAALQRYDEALADHGRAIQLDSTYAKAYSNRGIIHASLQRYDEALADFDQAIKLDPNWAVAFYHRGLAYAKTQHYYRAVEDFTSAIELDPALVPAYTDRGLAFAFLQSYDEATADYNRAIELDPNYALAHVNMGLLLLQRGAPGRALYYLEKAARSGNVKGAQLAMQVGQELGVKSATEVSSNQLAVEAFILADSSDEMQWAIAEFPSMTEADFIAITEQVISQVPPEHRPAFEQRLFWLRQIANEQKGQEDNQ